MKALFYFLPLFVLFESCSSKQKIKEEQTQTPPIQNTPQKVPAKKERMQPLDFSGDGHPRIRKFYNSSEAVVKIECDFNGDGRTDFIQNFDPSGRFVVEEISDLDGNGSNDLIYRYLNDQSKGPVLVSQEFLNPNNGQVFIWKFYNNGELVRREIDRRSLGKADYWEYYEKNKLIRVEKDDNQDGIPDSLPKLRQIVKPQNSDPLKNTQKP